MPSYPRFIADSMLGHIARWLRLLGYDTLYYRAISDWRLMKIAKEEDRILLTRDLGLYRRARKNGVRTLFIEEPSLEKVLAILSIKYSIRLDFDKNDTRCPSCNNQLKYTTSLIEVSHKIDKNIALKYNEFWVCNSCGKIYWQGNHWKTITELLDRAKIEKLKILNRVKPLEKNV
ncbi:MAG: Mut7-C RNAse domain-containing protein [Ignisphaera sp.]